MTSRPLPGRLVRLGGPAAALIVALSACSGGDAPAPAPSSVPTQDASNSPQQVGEDGLPADFPRDTVPIVEGDVVSSRGPSKDFDGYTVLVSVPKLSRAEAVTGAVATLTDAGWTSKTQVSGEQPAAQVLTRDGATLILVNGTQRGATSLTYSLQLGG